MLGIDVNQATITGIGDIAINHWVVVLIIDWYAEILTSSLLD